MNEEGWIGVDLDGTLAHYDELRSIDHIGEPLMPMVARVKAWLAEGRTVKIFTARVSGIGCLDLYTGTPLTEEHVIAPIKAWCKLHLGRELEVTNVKDYLMIELWDDRAIQVISNTGEPALPQS
jgi:hypothetical protein